MTYEPVIIIGAIVAIGEILKPFGIPTKWLPIINIVLGLVASFFFTYTGAIAPVLFEGLIYGLTASGVYDLAGKPIRNAIVKPTV